jgi:cob(I)alamin adenosyltransferase
MAFYTRAGDGGNTRLYGRAAKKSGKVFDAIGNIDELNSAIGVAIANLTDDNAEKILNGVQNSLFVIGARLAGYSGPHGKREISGNDVTAMEKLIDEYGLRIGDLKKFVLPGGSIGGAHLQNARAVARRAERSVVGLGGPHADKAAIKYLNRLSSLLFVMALYINKKEGYEELNPDY